MHQHEFYCVRYRDTPTDNVCIRCRVCNREWNIKPRWRIMLIVARMIICLGSVLLGIFLGLDSNELAQFERVLIIGSIFLCIESSCSLPAYLLCLYIEKTDKHEKFIEMLY